MSTAVLALLATISFVSLSTVDDVNKNESRDLEASQVEYEKKRQEKQAELERKKGQAGQKKQMGKRDACLVLNRHLDELHWFNMSRNVALERLMIMSRCLDPHSADFNFADVCDRIAKGIKDTSSPLRGKKIHSLYLNLYKELQCAEKEGIRPAPGETPQKTEERRKAVLRLFDALKDSDIIRQYPLLDDSKRIKEICAQALTLADKSKKDIVVLQKYILNKHASGLLEQSPYIKDAVKAAEEAYSSSHDGNKPSIKDLQDLLQENLSYLSLAAILPSVACWKPEEAILKISKGKLTPEVMKEKRRLAIPVIRELLELIRKDTDPAAAGEAGDAILNIANRMSGR